MFDRYFFTAISINIVSFSPIASVAQEMPKGEPNLIPDELGVNMLSGSPQLPSVKISIGGRGPGSLVYERWRGVEKDVWWQDSLSSRVYPGYSNSNVRYYDVLIGDGKSFRYNWTYGGRTPPTASVAGSPVIPDGTSLFRNSQVYTHTQKDGTVTSFINTCRSSSGRELYSATEFQIANFATEITKPNGEKITYTYASIMDGACWIAQRIQSINNNFGYQLHFDYATADIKSPAWRQVTAVTAINNAVDYCDKVAVTCSGLSQQWPVLRFSKTVTTSPYVEINNVVEPDGGITKYEYRNDNGNGTTSDSTLIVKKGDLEVARYRIRPESQGRVVSSASVGGSVWSYSLIGPIIPSPLRRAITRTDPSDRSRVVRSETLHGLIESYIDELGVETRYLYNANSQREYTISPNGTVDANGLPVSGYTKFEYDNRGNIVRKIKVPKVSSNLANIVTSSGYDSTCANPKTCNQPIWLKDANGGQTDFTYSGDHGGVMSKMGPAPANGAARPLVLTTYTQRSAWVKNNSGQLIQSLYPVWLISTKTQCQTVAGGNTPACDINAPIITTAYEYGANGTVDSMRVKGETVTSGGVSYRKCYRYDIMGRRVSETNAGAGLISCP